MADHDFETVSTETVYSGTIVALRADEVAQGILFVIENDFVTGTTIDVDGGWLLT